MTVDLLLKTYVKSLYYINNKLNLRYKYPTNQPFTEHRILQDLAIAKRIIEKELVYCAVRSNTLIPILRNRRHKSTIAKLTDFANDLNKNNLFSPSYESIDNIEQYLNLRHTKLYNHIVPSQVASSTIQQALPYIKLTKLPSILKGN